MDNSALLRQISICNCK